MPESEPTIAPIPADQSAIPTTSDLEISTGEPTLLTRTIPINDEPTAASTRGDGDSGLSVAGTVGIAAAVVALTVLLIAFVVLRRRKRQPTPSAPVGSYDRNEDDIRGDVSSIPPPEAAIGSVYIAPASTSGEGFVDEADLISRTVLEPESLVTEERIDMDGEEEDQFESSTWSAVPTLGRGTGAEPASFATSMTTILHANRASTNTRSGSVNSHVRSLDV